MAIAKRKKRFFNVSIPMIRKVTQLQAFEVKELDNRFIKYDLTRMLKGKATLITFRTHVDGEDVLTIPKELRLMPIYLKRMVRRGTNYVEDSFSIDCKNGVVKIKPFLITRRKVSRSVRKALRNAVKIEIEAWAKETNFEDMFEEILKNKIQRELSIKMKKIYPLSLCEIRVLKVEKENEISKE